MLVIPGSNLSSALNPNGSPLVESVKIGKASLATAAVSTILLSFSFLDGYEVFKLSISRKFANINMQSLWIAKCKEVRIKVDPKDHLNAKRFLKLEMLIRKIRGCGLHADHKKYQNLLIEFILEGGDPAITTVFRQSNNQILPIGILILGNWGTPPSPYFPENARNLERCMDLISARDFNWTSERNGIEQLNFLDPNPRTDSRIHKIFEKALISSPLVCPSKLLARAIEGVAPLTARVAIKGGANIYAVPGTFRYPITICQPMVRVFHRIFDLPEKLASPFLQIMSLLRDAAIDQFAEKLLPLCPKCLSAAQVSIIASYHETDLFDSKEIGDAINRGADLWFRNRSTKFDNRAIIMALKEAPRLLHLRDARGEALISKAMRARNTELVAYIFKEVHPMFRTLLLLKTA